MVPVPRMNALQIFAGPCALACAYGLAPAHVKAVSAAAGGPKGLTLLPLDRFLFVVVAAVRAAGRSDRRFDRCLADGGGDARPTCRSALSSLEHAYIHQDYDVPRSSRRRPATTISQAFRRRHPRCSATGAGSARPPALPPACGDLRGRHILHRDNRVRSPLGYASAFFTNIASLKAMGRGWNVPCSPRISQQGNGALLRERLPHAPLRAVARQLRAGGAGVMPDPVPAQRRARHPRRATRSLLGRRHYRLSPASRLSLRHRIARTQRPAWCCIRTSSVPSCLAGSTSR